MSGLKEGVATSTKRDCEVEAAPSGGEQLDLRIPPDETALRQLHEHNHGCVCGAALTLTPRETTGVVPDISV
jgi:hypothetical protein